MNKGVKIFFWVLVVANLGLFAAMKSGVFEGEQLAPAQREFNADKIVLLNIPQVPLEAAPHQAAEPAAASAPPATDKAASAAAEKAAPEKTAPEKAAPTVPEPAKSPSADAKAAAACYEWGEFGGADIERARKVLVKLQLDKHLDQRDSEQPKVFWVYIPPLKDKAAVTQKVAQLKARGVTDYFVVQDAGEWLNAISLGMFKTREAAQKFLEDLSAKDVRTAKMGERASKPKTTVFLISGASGDKIAKLTALQKDFENSELKSATCR